MAECSAWLVSNGSRNTVGYTYVDCITGNEVGDTLGPEGNSNAIKSVCSRSEPTSISSDFSAGLDPYAEQPCGYYDTITPTPTSTATPTPTGLAPTVTPTPTPTPTPTTTPLVYENRLISASAVGSSDSFIFYKNKCEVESNILLSSEGESVISAEKFSNGFNLSIPNDAVAIYVKSNLEDCPVCSGPLFTGNTVPTPTPTPTVSIPTSPTPTPTPTTTPTVSSGLRTGYIVRDCSSGDLLIASAFNVCNGEQISGQAFTKSAGDIIQFKYGTSCLGLLETQCGTIEEVRLVDPSTFNIILTSEDVIDNCNSPACFQ